MMDLEARISAMKQERLCLRNIFEQAAEGQAKSEEGLEMWERSQIGQAVSTLLMAGFVKIAEEFGERENADACFYDGRPLEPVSQKSIEKAQAVLRRHHEQVSPECATKLRVAFEESILRICDLYVLPFPSRNERNCNRATEIMKEFLVTPVMD